jgi:hypothetical protein
LNDSYPEKGKDGQLLTRRSIRTRQLTLALLACISLVLLSSQAALCFGRPGHMVLEFEGRGGCAKDVGPESHAAGFCSDDAHCGAGCIRLSLVDAALGRDFDGSGLEAPIAAEPFLPFFLAPGPEALGYRFETSPPLSRPARLRTPILRI